MRSLRSSSGWCAIFAVAAAAAIGAPTASADALYNITNLGTLSGQSSSVATGINNNGQVVGVSYNSGDGSFASGIFGPTSPPRFWQTGDGAQSFLYSGGQMSQVSPIGGLAISINNSGQVVGGNYNSNNDSGQYVGGAGAGVYPGNDNMPNQLVSGGTTTVLNISPYSINNAGEITGFVLASNLSHAATYLNGQYTDLYSKIGSYGQISQGVAINNQGDVLITSWASTNVETSYLYHASNGAVTNLSALPGGSGMIGAALNNSDQVVGNGYLYKNGSIQSLLSLLPASSGWSNLNATGINDSGQIVGQGTYDGQQLGFLMTPEPSEVPEPSTLATWALIASCLKLRGVARRAPVND